MTISFLNEYLSIIIFLFLALGLSIGFIFLNFLFSPKNPDPEKLSAYECGFEAFSDSSMEFDVRFYLVAILFEFPSFTCNTFIILSKIRFYFTTFGW